MSRAILRWRMSLSENRYPSRIKSGAGFFRDMRYRVSKLGSQVASGGKKKTSSMIRIPKYM